jgi:hypothetical protein
VCRELRALVTNFAWDDRDPDSHVAARKGAVKLWCACFPRAVACTLSTWRGNVHVTDADLALLRGVRFLDMKRCRNVTDAGLAHLAGIHTLDMRSCDQKAITDAAFTHLAGIHTLKMSCCRQKTITDSAFAAIWRAFTPWTWRVAINRPSLVPLLPIWWAFTP